MIFQIISATVLAIVSFHVQAAPLPNDSLYSNGDFISVHYDSCPDKDDLHAAVAGKMVLDFYGLSRDKDYIVINGSCGFDLPSTSFVDNSPTVFNELYGPEGSTFSHLNAYVNQGSSEVSQFQSNAINQAANKWIATLNNNNKVFVLDGGPMDFTALVLQRMNALGFSGNYKNISVFQHSTGTNFNEIKTDDSNLAFMKSTATYVPIDNGNLSNNNTPDLRTESNTNSTEINEARNNPTYGSAWNTAFSILDPIAAKFDGSDTVEMLWVFGLDSNDIADWTDFFDMFTGGSVVVPATGNKIAVVGNSLADARTSFSNATNQPRVDCDSIGDGRWLCANFNNPTLSDVGSGGTTPITPPAPPVQPPTTVTPSNNSRIAAIGGNLAQARSNYSNLTSGPTVDCDSIGDGRWICANFNNPILSDVDGSGTTPVTPTAPPVQPPTVVPPSNNGRIAAIGGNLAQARSNYSRLTSGPTVDCDSIGDGRWICANFNNPTLSDVDGSASSGGSTGNTGASSGSSGNGTVNGNALFNNGDFISVHYDSCPDNDDIHSAVAGKMILDFYGLSRNSDYMVVNGTCGTDEGINNGRFVSKSVQIFNQLYGSEGSTNTWINAISNSNAVNLTANKWTQAINSNRTVFAVEGGPMDFTSRVLNQMSSSDRGKVTVIQHSNWNQNKTNDSNLSFVRSSTNYIRIDDGNHSNRTPDLQENNPRESILQRAQNDSTYGNSWDLAFNLFNPRNNPNVFDGSDAVELLWIFDIDSSDFSGWDGFFDMF